MFATFDVLHDAVSPLRLLRAIREGLRPDGRYICMEAKGSEKLTERIRLGTDVTCIYYRHPAMVARLPADLDNLSQGRLILGLGCGWDANEFANFGMPFPPLRERQKALEEAITIIRSMIHESRVFIVVTKGRGWMTLCVI